MQDEIAAQDPAVQESEGRELPAAVAAKGIKIL
jgi:hypothetical protein